MPLRSPKMYFCIFGFQRLVWWPKCTPASSSSFIVKAAMDPPSVVPSAVLSEPFFVGSPQTRKPPPPAVLRLARRGSAPMRRPACAVGGYASELALFRTYSPLNSHVH